MEGLEPVGKPLPALFRHLPRGVLINAVYPGVLVALTIALASFWMSLKYGAPVMLFALLFGMAFHFLHEEGRCVSGIEFSSRSILRVGVALLGVRITVEQIASLGIMPVLAVTFGVILTVAAGWVLARVMGLRSSLGVLSGGAVAICGASAALAVASVLPKHSESERDTILTVVGVTTLSTIAMIVYPAIVPLFGLSDEQAGIFLGGTIHDVAQVIGAGYMISDEAGDISVYIKLLRVAMLLPVVVAIALVVSRGGSAKKGEGPSVFPLFLVGFMALVAANSAGLIPDILGEWITAASRWFLVTAIAALGMKTSFGQLAAVGWRPVALMLAETAFIGFFVLAALLFVI